MAQMPALIPKEVEIQRLKKIWLIIIAMGSTAASVEEITSLMVLYIKPLSEIVHLHQHTGGYTPTSSHYHLDGEQQQSMIEKFQFLEAQIIQ